QRTPQRRRVVRDRRHPARPGPLSRCADVVLPHAGPGRRHRSGTRRRHRGRARRTGPDPSGRTRTRAGDVMTLNFDMGADAARLRGELRQLIAEHVPAGYLGAFTDDPADLEVAQQFCRTLAERNLLCLSWPSEYGGGDASVWEQTVVREEMWAHHEPRGAQYMGVNWVGPISMRHGTEEQQRTHLPPIARGEVIWCQGFSEPEAGSDLASLRTFARRAGDNPTGW